MRRAMTVLSLALLAGAPALLAQDATDSRPGIAVLPFENGGSYGQDKENFEALQRGIPGMLISELAQNPAARVVDRAEIQKLLGEQDLGEAGRVDAATAAKIGKLVGAKYMIAGTFVDLYGRFRMDARIINVETSEILKVVKAEGKRDDLFRLIQTLSENLMKETKLPPLPAQVGQAVRARNIPTEALTYYSRALLYEDRGDRAKAAEYFSKATTVFPEYAEAQEGLRRARGG